MTIPDNASDQNEHYTVIDPDDAQSELYSVVEPADTANQNESYSIVEPDDAQGEHYSIVEPNEAQNERYSIVEPDDAQNVRYSIVDPDDAQGEHYSIVEPDNAAFQSEHYTVVGPDGGPGTVEQGEHYCLVEPDESPISAWDGDLYPTSSPRSSVLVTSRYISAWSGSSHFEAQAQAPANGYLTIEGATADVAETDLGRSSNKISMQHVDKPPPLSCRSSGVTAATPGHGRGMAARNSVISTATVENVPLNAHCRPGCSRRRVIFLGILVAAAIAIGVGVATGLGGGLRNSSASASAGPVTCSSVLPPLNGTVTGSCNGTVLGGICTSACNPGYMLSVAGDTTRTCGHEGFSGAAKTCDAVICPPLHAPRNGTVSGNCGGAFGDVCNSSCNLGFTLSVTGDAVRTCGQDGTFSGAAKTCEAVTCPPISAPRNGIVKGNCDGGYGDICTYVCNPGYWLSAMGNATRKCSQDATYSGRPKTCKAVTCPQCRFPRTEKLLATVEALTVTLAGPPATPVLHYQSWAMSCGRVARTVPSAGWPRHARP